jgi:hypothetical protein
MKLEGKSLEMFEAWYNNKKFNFNVVSNIEGDIDTYSIELVYFYQYNESMQYGVYVDFFDNVGINISIEPYWCVCKLTTDIPQDVTFDMMVFSDSENGGEYSNYKTRPQAREQAISKAMEIYNNRK